MARWEAAESGREEALWKEAGRLARPVAQARVVLAPPEARAPHARQVAQAPRGALVPLGAPVPRGARVLQGARTPRAQALAR